MIINEVVNYPDEDWQKDLIDKVVKCILGSGGSGISVYRSDTLDPLDYGHALAVIAESISQDGFRSKRKHHCTRGSLIIPTACFPKTTSYDFTPENNLDFYPANNYHFDLTINDAEELAIALLNGIKRGVIAWSILGNDDKFLGSYRIQAAIAYSHCLQTFGKLNPDKPPSIWANGKNITASEQIETLQHLAQTKLVDCPPPALT